MKKVKLKVLGISYSQTQSGAYALILAEEQGKRRIPIIIGGFEAQSIAIEMEGLKPPRPLTHDLFVNFAEAYSIKITEVIITKLEEGIFHSELICSNGSSIVKIDARTSDSISLALRFNCPIYTYPEIIDKAGIELELEQNDDKKNLLKKQKPSQKEPPKPVNEEEYSQYSNDELKKIMSDAIEKEDYETASNIRDEINKRLDKK